MIAAKVLEVEDAVRGLGPPGARVVEVHPETSFAVMARHFRAAPAAAKRSAPGVAQRIDLLSRTLTGLDVVSALAGVPAGSVAGDRVPVDDALDALAAACSALRHAYGQAHVLGEGTEAVWSDGTPAPGRAVIVV
jgi:predicted RNase H-like nuclease